MFKRYARHIVMVAIVIPVIVAGLLLLPSRPPLQAGGQTISAAAPTDVFTCTPTGVAAFTSRVHVRCSPAAPGNISYFAVCTTNDSATASRFLSVFTTAKVTGKNLDIFYTASDTTSGTACGCAAGDCRLAWGAEVKP